MSVVLFVDLLGARKRWQAGGVDESMRTFFTFKTLVKRAVRTLPSGEVLEGGIENDSAMLVCRSTTGAVRIARDLFLNAFRRPLNPTATRHWYRGCVVPHVHQSPLRIGDSLGQGLENVAAFRYSPAAVEALSVEKSGYKGMRLLVSNTLVTQELQDATRIPVGDLALVPFRRLVYSHYPSRIQGDFADFLWMATPDEDEWFSLGLQMTSRLRYAAKDDDEFLQAAATYLVFAECAAIRRSLISKARRADARRMPHVSRGPGT